MALTNDQLLDRIELIETAIQTIQNALLNLPVKKTLNNLTALMISDINALRDEVGQRDSTGALLVPRFSTAQRDALEAISGMVIFNTTTNVLNYYDGSTWQAL
jgi:hypothetical protein